MFDDVDVQRNIDEPGEHCSLYNEDVPTLIVAQPQERLRKAICLHNRSSISVTEQWWEI